MSNKKKPYAFLEEDAVMERLSNRGRLVVFGAGKMIVDGAFQDDLLRKRMQNLRSHIPDLKVWYLFESGDDPETTLKKLRALRAEQNELEKPPRVIFVAPSRAEMLSVKSDAFAPENEIRSILLADHFLVLTADDIHIDLSSHTETQGMASNVPLSPIENILATEMREAGLEFETQISLKPYCVDFVVKRNGVQLIVEADGQDFHDVEKDAERDRIILERHGLKTLRFSGSQIFRAPDRCVHNIISQLDGFVTQAVNVSDEMSLDPHQAKAVCHGAGHARVLAPAGSGKTKVLVSRIVHLINSGVDPTGILALAFNRKAARQLEERLQTLGVPLDRRSASDGGVVVATLNAFAFRLLKAEGWSGEILDTKIKETRVLNDALKNVGIVLGPMRGSNPIVEVLEDINRIKRGLLRPTEEIIEIEQQKGTVKIEVDQVWGALQDLQSRRHQISFEDQVFLATDLLLRNSEIRHRWQSCYDHILVDEFQDLNPAQSLLIRVLVAPSANLFAVGDDDQLIYSWRSAEVQNLLDGFVSTYAEAATYALGVNYRCAKDIVRTGQRLIEHNRVRFPKTIQPAKDAPIETLELVAGDGLSELGAELVYFANEHISAGVRVSDIAVLARTNTQLLAAALALDKAGIPRSPLEGVKLYSLPIGKRLISYLDTCLRAPLYKNAILLPDIVNRPNRFVSNIDVEKLRQSADPWLAAQVIALNPQTQKMRTSALLKLLQNIEQIGPVLHSESVSVAEKLQLVATTFAFIETQDAKTRDREKATEDMVLDIMIEDAKGFEDIFSYLKHCKERATAETNGEAKTPFSEYDKERVTLSTIHAAKGREWSTVCLFDASKSNSRQEVKPNELEEERRVFYVGMTRASLNLQISFVKGRPLQFINEAFLPKNTKVTSIEDYLALVASSRSEAEATQSRAAALLSRLEQNRIDTDIEKSGERLRDELNKLDQQENTTNKDITAARLALNDANKLKTGGRLGQLLQGKSSPQTKADMVRSATDLMSQLEKRLEKLENKRLQLRSRSEQREIELLREAQKTKVELESTDAHLETVLQRVADLERAKPLFTDE